MSSSLVAAPSKKIDAEGQFIRNEILRIGNEFRSRYPFLERHQNAIGFTILMAAAAVTFLTVYLLYIEAAWLPYWVGVVVIMFSTSIAHEIEHDTIHNLYFQGSLVNDFMLLVCWLARWNTISPWARRRLHFWHHKTSGTPSDLEERAITNGEPFSLVRVIMMTDQMLSFFLRPIQIISIAREYRLGQPGTRAQHLAYIIENATMFVPIGIVHYALFWSFVTYHAIVAVSGVQFVPLVLLNHMPLISAYFWCFGFPNAIRAFCLVFVSSNMHYYGDIGNPSDVVRQTQVWHTLWTLPLDLFTFNFGSTHGIHHFVVRDTFYIRQAIAPSLYPIMKAHGVRFNDFGSILRGNRWNEEL